VPAAAAAMLQRMRARGTVKYRRRTGATPDDSGPEACAPGVLDRPSGRKGERGQASSEYVGLIVLATVLVVAFVARGPTVGGQVAGGIQELICKIVGQGCRAPARSYEPQEPCRLAADEVTASIGATVWSVKLGGEFVATKERRSDGTWRVTLKAGGKLGAELELGESAHAGRPGGKAGEGLDAKLSGTLNGAAANVYEFRSEQEADAFLDAVAREAARLAATALDPTHGLLSGLANLLLPHEPFRPPAPRQTFFEGGGGFDASAAGGSGAYAKGALGGSALLGVRLDHASGEQTYYFKVGGKAKGEAGVLFGPGATGGVEGEGVISVKVDKHGNARTLTLESTHPVHGGLNLLGKADDLSSLTRVLKEVSVGGTGETGQTVALSARLDLADPENAAAAAAMLRSLGITGLDLLLRRPDPADVVDLYQASKRLYERFDRDGTISYTVYDTTSGGVSAGLSVGAGIAFGIEGGVTDQSGRLTEARYRVPGVGFVPWTACTG
jgi:hypothetical protein